MSCRVRIMRRRMLLLLLLLLVLVLLKGRMRVLMLQQLALLLLLLLLHGGHLELLLQLLQQIMLQLLIALGCRGLLGLGLLLLLPGSVAVAAVIQLEGVTLTHTDTHRLRLAHRWQVCCTN